MSAIKVDKQDHIAVVTLDRPPVNSLQKSTYAEIAGTFRNLGDMPGVRVAVLRSGGPIFCAGNDVNEFVGIENAADVERYARGVSDGISSVYDCAVPVVAAVHGHALGAGMALAACADVIVAADDAEFGIPEIKVGVIGASAFLGLMVPEKVARYMSLTGDPISARAIHKYGGIQSLVPAADVLDTAMAVAGKIAANGPTGVRYFKAAMNKNQGAMLVEKYAHESGYTAKYIETAEARESVAAFLERRKPRYD